MTKRTHTPGPLMVHRQPDNVRLGAEYSIQREILDPADRGGVVALVDLSEGSVADLNLWASAPDLLEALVGIVDRLPRTDTIAAMGHTESPELKAARAAIRRAQGEGSE